MAQHVLIQAHYMSMFGHVRPSIHSSINAQVQQLTKYIYLHLQLSVTSCEHCSITILWG